MKFEYISCNVCGSGKTRFVGKRESPDRDLQKKTNIVKCRRCGLIYPNPMPYFTDEEVQDNFGSPEEYFSVDSHKRLRPFEDVLCEIERVKPQKGCLLDIGCGRGELAHVAGKRGWHVTGTEISESFAHYAREKFNINALIGDLAGVNLMPESFDAVSLFSVIQYLQDPQAALIKIYSLLKKGGVLYIETTNEDALVFGAGDLFKSVREGRKVTTHLSPLFSSYQIYGFNKKSLKAALESAGFKISYIKTGGSSGGGVLAGSGFGNTLLNLIRKIIILIGGLMGRGHLIFCIARKD